MLPNFLIIGAQKAATSWLAKCLGEHPDVFMAEREIHFFNHRFQRGLAWYEGHFRDWSGEAAIGEKTPGYMNHPEAPGRIRSTLGDSVKLIASLRHPVDRAYSAFWQSVKQGHIPADTDFRTLFLRGGGFELHTRGYYSTHLRRYLGCFPRENLLILVYEELRKDNQKAIRNCLEFLSMDSQFVPNGLNARVNRGRDLKLFHGQAVAMRRLVARKALSLPKGLREPFLGVGRFAFEHLILRRLPKRSNYVPLDEDVRQELLRVFESDIRQLEDLLDRDFSIWYRQASEPLSSNTEGRNAPSEIQEPEYRTA